MLSLIRLLLLHEYWNFALIGIVPSTYSYYLLKLLMFQIEQLKRQKLKNPNIFVSTTRLCVHNIPKSIDDKALRQVCIKAVTDKKSRITEVSVVLLFCYLVSVFLCKTNRPIFGVGKFPFVQVKPFHQNFFNLHFYWNFSKFSLNSDL